MRDRIRKTSMPAGPRAAQLHSDIDWGGLAGLCPSLLASPAVHGADAANNEGQHGQKIKVFELMLKCFNHRIKINYKAYHDKKKKRVSEV